jgi:transposase-like protein
VSISKRKRFSPDYKHELVELVRKSKSNCRQVALEVGVNTEAKPQRFASVRLAHRPARTPPNSDKDK